LLKSKQDSPMFIVAQSKTVTALQSLDTERQRLLIQFFKSANLNTLDGGKGLLFKARMSKAQLQGIDLSEINLKEVDFSGANLSGANLDRSNLSGSNLVETNFKKASLVKANLNGIDFHEADFQESDLKEADFTNSLMLRTKIHNVYNLEKGQFEKTNKPLICGTSVPEHIKINYARDCNEMPQALLKRYPKSIKNIEEAKYFIYRESTEIWGY
jgi:Pentapeptide repeats (8 copies)